MSRNLLTLGSRIAEPDSWVSRILDGPVLEPEFVPLFTDAERAVARKRLTKLGYTPK